MMLRRAREAPAAEPPRWTLKVFEDAEAGVPESHQWGVALDCGQQLPQLVVFGLQEKAAEWIARDIRAALTPPDCVVPDRAPAAEPDARLRDAVQVILLYTENEGESAPEDRVEIDEAWEELQAALDAASAVPGAALRAPERAAERERKIGDLILRSFSYDAWCSIVDAVATRDRASPTLLARLNDVGDLIHDASASNVPVHAAARPEPTQENQP